MQVKIALVTGGTSGIGLEVCTKLIHEKIFVIICSETKACPRQVSEKLDPETYEYVKCDITRVSDITKLKTYLYKKYGRLDYLHANAGVIPMPCGINDITEESIERAVSTNLVGTFWILKIMGKFIQDTSTDGAIVTTTSVDGIIGEPYAVMYSATKAGIISLTKSSARAFKEPLVRVNAVAPGLIDTPLTRSSGEDPISTTSISVIQRMGRAEEVASSVTFLLSEKSSFITGQVHVIDGGFTLK